MRIFTLTAAIAICAGLASCAELAPFAPFRHSEGHNSSSLVQFLYPHGAEPPVKDQIPELHVPLRIGLAFLPSSPSATPVGLTRAQEEALLERIREHFSRRRFVSQIVVIPDYYLTGVQGFEGLQGVQRLYDVDLMALVSYDQVTNMDVNGWSISYWTIAGAYMIKGNRYDVATLIDLAVVDPATHSLVLRAGGTDTRHGNVTPIAEGRELRGSSGEGFSAATNQMIGHFDAALDQLASQVRAGTAQVRVVSRSGSNASGGGAGGFGWLDLVLLVPFVAARIRRARCKGGTPIMSRRFKWGPVASAAFALALASRMCGAEVFETPADEPPSASLSAAQVSGPSFHVESPVHSDGLMHRYVIDSGFGTFSAYGIDALNTRLREIAALTTLAKTSKGQVALESAMRGMHDEAKGVVRVVTHPVGTVIGIPTGIGHLLGGYRAEAEEVTAEVSQTVASSHASSASQPEEGAFARVGASATHAARSEADSYLGLSAAERRWYGKLGVDPYTNNVVLRRAVARLAKVDAAASLGMRFAPVGIPFAGEVERALDAMDREDPAVLRKRRREALLHAGLSAEEVERFEHTPLLTPTRQTLLADALKALDGVDGRAELVRHAMTVQSEEETEVFLQSVLLLVRFHAHQPVERILPGVRIPAAELAGGRIVVFGAFDAVEWTAEVADYEHALREALPPAAARELWTSGTVSSRARAALEERSWSVHDGAADLVTNVQ